MASFPYKRTADDKLEHRVKIGAGKGMIVHHKDENKGNNARSNLRTITRAEHNREHKAIYGTRKSCAVCGKTFTPPKTHRKDAQTCSEGCASKLMARRARARSRS